MLAQGGGGHFQEESGSQKLYFRNLHLTGKLTVLHGYMFVGEKWIGNRQLLLYLVSRRDVTFVFRCFLSQGILSNGRIIISLFLFNLTVFRWQNVSGWELEFRTTRANGWQSTVLFDDVCSATLF